MAMQELSAVAGVWRFGDAQRAPRLCDGLAYGPWPDARA